MNKLFSISNWWFLIPCYCQNSIGDLWNTLCSNNALSSLYLKIHAFIVMSSLLVILSQKSKMVPHACRDVSRTLHAYESMWNASYLMMWIYGEMCTWLYLLFSDTCTLVMMVITSWWFYLMMIYFGDSDKVWIIYTWLDDFFDDDTFLVYILEMMVAFIWNNYVRILYEHVYLKMWKVMMYYLTRWNETMNYVTIHLIEMKIFVDEFCYVKMWMTLFWWYVNLKLFIVVELNSWLWEWCDDLLMLGILTWNIVVDIRMKWCVMIEL